MKTSFYTFAAALIFSTALTASAYAATKVGVAGAVNPDVRVKGADGKERVLKIGDEIYLNDTITTTAKGAAQLMFLDKSALTISPNAAVKIDEFVYNPTTNDGVMSLNSAKGAFRFIGGALTKKQPVKIKTPVSTIGIRGGIVDANNGNAVFVYGEQMSVTDQNGNTLTTSEFGSGLGVDANGNVQQLPPEVVSNMIENSPVDSAASTGTGTLDSSFDSQLDAGSGAASSSSDNGGNAGASDVAGNDASSNGTTNSGDSAQENLRSDVNEFVESGGDADGDGVLDFDVAGTDLVNPDGGLIINPDLIDNGGNDNDNGGDTPIADGGDTGSDNGGDTPVADGGNDDNGGSTPPPPAGGGGGGGGPSNGAPVNTVLALAADGLEKVVFSPNDRSLIIIETKPSGSAASLMLDGITDPEGDTLTVVPGSVTFSNGTVNPWSSSGHDGYRLTAHDVAAGSTQNFTLTFQVTDGTNITTVTRTVIVTGQDLFGNSTAWSSQLPALPDIDSNPATDTATHFGRFTNRDGSAAPEEGTIEAYIPASNTSNFHAVFKDDGASSYTDYHAVSINKTFGTANNQFSGASATLNSPDFILEDFTGEDNISTNFSGKAHRTFFDSFYAYYLNWDEASSPFATQRANFVLGTSPLFADFASVTPAEAALYNLIANSALWATNNNVGPDGIAGTLADNSRIIEYDFLPEMYATGGDFGYLDYNKAVGFGTAPSSNGLLVDWGNGRFMGGYLSFTGSTTASGQPRLIATVGKVNYNAATSGLVLTGNSITAGKTLEGQLYDSLSIDYGSDGVTGEEVSLFNGVLNADITNTFSPLAGEHVEGLVLNGTVFHRDNAGSLNRNIVQPVAISDGGRYIGDVNGAGGALPGASANLSLKGFSAGLISDHSSPFSEVSRITTQDANDLKIELTRSSGTNYVYGTGGATAIAYREVDAGTTFNPANTNTNPRIIKFGGGAPDGKSAVIDKDRYIADTNGNNYFSGFLPHQGVIASAKAVGAESLVCNSCQFAHWGVWSATTSQGTYATTQTTSIVPYVAGELYDVPAAGSLGGQTGTITYNGQMAGNKIDSSSNLINVTGTFGAQIDMDNRAVTAFAGTIGGRNFGFNGMNAINTLNGVSMGANLHGVVANTDFYNDVNVNGTFEPGTDDFEGYRFNDTTNSFHAPVGYVEATSAEFNDPTLITGSINGGLYGANAEELGGNFNIKDGVGPTAELTAGIYLGAR